ncbi:MAG TPA: PD-(D/E)XK nuclease family protein, partial [Candidatus Bathyarchaeia archaeon]|nr:PD-(D/E)XK nuclease family protein [Candidatus Bathyarchaeia archaeon]
YLDEMASQETIREGDAAVQPDGSGAITLMTIHKAKGLEFPIVVIPDTARSRRRSGPGDIALHREFGFGVRITGDEGEPLSTTMHRIIGRAHEAKKNAEHARILYVGMTRARDWLLIGGAPDPPSGSWFAEFDKQYGLTHCEDGHTFCGAYGSEPWSAVVRRAVADEVDVTEAIPAETTVPERSEIEIRANPLMGFNTRERVLPVSVILDWLFGAFNRTYRTYGTNGEAELGLGDPGGPMADGVSPAFRGTLVHRLFELWRFDHDPPVDAVLERECPGLGVQAAMASYLRDVAARFLESPLGKRMRAAHIEREVPFLLRLDEAVVSGTIDAVLEDGTLVDYKTGARKAETHARYEWQLALYAIAARRLKGIAPPLGLLYYVDCGETSEVDLSRERLDEVISRTEAILRMPRRS